jgi:hypothetical protein
MSRYYLITFDLRKSHNRQSEYRAIRDAIKKYVGARNYFEPLKQCCMVRTENIKAMDLRNRIAPIVFPGNALIIRLRYGYSTDIIDPIIRKKTKEWLSGVPKS